MKFFKNKKSRIILFTAFLLAFFFGVFNASIVNMSYADEENSPVEITIPSRVLLGDPSGWEQYKGATIWDWNNFKIEINNTTEYEMTGISISLTGTGNLVGVDGGTENFHIDNLPTSIAANSSNTSRGYGVIKSAFLYTVFLCLGH